MADRIVRTCVLFGCKTIPIRSCYLSTSCPSLIKWRYEQGVEPNPNRYGKLTNLPDYSFVDGRPVPMGMNAYRRMKLQESYCEKIVKLSGEIDFAVERYNRVQEESKLKRQRMIESKLKPKGKKLLENPQKPRK